MTSLAPQLNAHFVSAEVKCFEYDALDAAVAWARGGRAVGMSAAYPLPNTTTEAGQGS